MTRWLAILCLLASPANGQTITDGDTLRMDGKIYRLHGIDASEMTQTCADGWPAGRIAATRLLELTQGKTVICQERDRDRYGRIVAVCWAGGADLGALMVRSGMAWAYVRYSRDYVDLEAKARAEGLGVHAHGCMVPWEWRRENQR